MSLPDADRAASFDGPTLPAILTRVLKEHPVAPSRLVPKVGGGRWAVHDILANTIRSNELIMNGEQDGKTFYDIQDVGEPYHMQTFDQALVGLVQAGLVSEGDARLASTSPHDFVLALRGTLARGPVG